MKHNETSEFKNNAHLTSNNDTVVNNSVAMKSEDPTLWVHSGVISAIISLSIVSIGSLLIVPYESIKDISNLAIVYVSIVLTLIALAFFATRSPDFMRDFLSSIGYVIFVLPITILVLSGLVIPINPTFEMTYDFGMGIDLAIVNIIVFGLLLIASKFSVTVKDVIMIPNNGSDMTIGSRIIKGSSFILWVLSVIVLASVIIKPDLIESNLLISLVFVALASSFVVVSIMVVPKFLYSDLSLQTINTVSKENFSVSDTESETNLYVNSAKSVSDSSQSHPSNINPYALETIDFNNTPKE